MTNKDKKVKTISYYDRYAKDWVIAHGGSTSPSYWLDEIREFNKLLPRGRILEIGSGAGRDAKCLIEMGYEYIGTDASSGLLKIARETNPGVEFKLMDVENLDFPENFFDGFWSVATLLHIPKDSINSVLGNIWRVVKPGGIGFISLKKGEGESEDEETGRWFAYYSEEEFRRILSANNFAIVKMKTRETDKSTWLEFFVKTVKS